MPLRTRVVAAIVPVGFLFALTAGLANIVPRRVEPLVAPPADQPASGIDTSSYQHVGRHRIDWVAVRRSGVSYALIKATEGSSLDDPWFERDWKAAAAAGLYRGAYHYARPAAGTAADDAGHFLDVVGPLDGREDLPPVLDLEEDGGLDPDALAGWVGDWVATVEQRTGRRPIIYAGSHFWGDRMADTPRFADSPLWYAHHTEADGPGATFGGWTTWTLWQWSDSGSVPGISVVVDLDRLQGGGPALEALAAARSS
ncbi:MAG: glycoside hydrolase family 25 protein [Acidimicrobiales bacterium]